MKIALITFDRLTLLDLVGFYDPITRLKTMGYIPELTWTFCGYSADVTDNFGFPVQVDQVQPDLSGFDLVFLPGGFGTRPLLREPSFLQWLQTAAPVPLKTSVCTGSLLWGAADFLQGIRATTHFDEYVQLASFGAVVQEVGVVEDQGIVTAGAVASSLDLGLYICQKLAGAEACKNIRTRMGLD